MQLPSNIQIKGSVETTLSFFFFDKKHRFFDELAPKVFMCFEPANASGGVSVQVQTDEVEEDVGAVARMSSTMERTMMLPGYGRDRETSTMVSALTHVFSGEQKPGGLAREAVPADFLPSVISPPPSSSSHPWGGQGGGGGGQKRTREELPSELVMRYHHDYGQFDGYLHGEASPNVVGELFVSLQF